MASPGATSRSIEKPSGSSATDSDSEVLLNVLALELERAAQHHKLDPDAIFKAVAGVHRRCRGAYAVVAMIAGYGMLAFVLVAGLTTLPRANWWQNSALAPPFVAAALVLKPWLPERWAERLDFSRDGAPRAPSQQKA